MFWRRKQRQADLERELRDHLDLETAEQAEHGLDPKTARHAAQRALGNLGLINENTCDAWGWTWLERAWQDLRYATRRLAKSPGFASVAIISLALGIGASTAIFSVVSGVLIRPLPYPESDRLVRIWETIPKRSIDRNVVNAVNFLDWREGARAFEGIAALQEIPMNIAGQGEPVSMRGLQVTSGFFSILGVKPMLGRTFTDEEGLPGRGRVVMIAHELWQSHFGGDPQILSRQMRVNLVPMQIIGVMPAGFSFPGSRAQLWVPLPFDRGPLFSTGRSYSTVARLKDGVTLEQANEDMRRMAAQTERDRPQSNTGFGASVVPLLEDSTRNVRVVLVVLMGAVGFLLLIACANVANLFLMRGAESAQEIALRQTLGASQGRIFRQYLTESLLICFVAAAAGVAAGQLGLGGLLSLLPPEQTLPRADSIRLDANVFTFVLLGAFATTVLFGMVPLIGSGRRDLQQSLRFRGRVANKAVRRAFVMVQIALSLILLAGAGLMTGSFRRLLAVDPGFSIERVLAVDILTSPARFFDPRLRSEYFESLLAEVRGVAGVEAASSIHMLPLENGISASCFGPTDTQPGASSPSARVLVVGPDYFSTMRSPVFEGREFTVRDRLSSPAAMLVNRAFVRKFMPDENPLGKRWNVCWGNNGAREIVGIVDDFRHETLRALAEPTIFLASAQAPPFFATLVIRAREDPAALSQAVAAAIHRVNPDQAVSRVRTMENVKSAALARPRFELLLMTIFAGVALVLAAVGVYGVTAYSVAQRTREIGVRVAIGATRGNVAGLVLQEGALLAVVGLSAGLGGALALTRFLATLLYEIQPTDPATLASVGGFMAAVTMSAILVPLRRAVGVDPMIALRYE